MTSLRKFDSFIFTHIPKCGGTSFRKFVFSNAVASGVKEELIYIPGFSNIPNENNLDQIQGERAEAFAINKLTVLADHTPYNGQLRLGVRMPRAFRCTILRDPVERFMSHYNFFYRKLGYEDCKDIHLNDLDQEKLDDLLGRLSNVQVKFIAGYNDLGEREKRPMNKLFFIAKYNLNYCFHEVGVLEDMEYFIERLNGHKDLFMNFEGSVGHMNVNRKSDDTPVREDLLERIKNANRFDQRLYNIACKINEKSKTRNNE